MNFLNLIKPLLKTENIKTIAIIALGVFVFIHYNNYRVIKFENKRIKENNQALILADSLRITQLDLTTRELEKYITQTRADLAAFLKEEKIRLRSISNVTTHEIRYIDTVKTEPVDLSPVLTAIENRDKLLMPIKEADSCMIVEGYVLYDNHKLHFDLTKKEFRNKSDIVSYWERNQWKFLGIKTRLFGRKQTTIIVKNTCGESKTITLDKVDRKGRRR